MVPPKLLVADELSLGLAPVVVDAVYEGLEAINRNGTAMLVVEQQVDRVLKIASKALVLDRGRVAYDGSPSGAATAVNQILSRREEASARAAAFADGVTTSDGLTGEVVHDREADVRPAGHTSPEEIANPNG